jgi:hypothetical protein
MLASYFASQLLLIRWVCFVDMLGALRRGGERSFVVPIVGANWSARVLLQVMFESKETDCV